MNINLPNKLTLLRILAVPLLVVVYYSSQTAWPAVMVFILASMTDWLDGYAARQSNQVTPLGAFLDPVADKLLVITVLIVLMAGRKDFVLTLAGTMIICREVLVSALREWLAQMDSDAKLAVSIIAKIKTALQMVAITCLLLASKGTSWVWYAGTYILLISLILSILSLINYVKIAWPVLTFGTNSE